MNKAETTLREPLVRLAKQDGVPMKKKIGIRAAAIVLALVIDAIFIVLVTKLNPIQVYAEMFKGTFETSLRFMWAMRDMVSLLCIGIALAPAFKMRFWNIGAEGQVLMGGFATALCMMYCQSLPTPVLFLVMIITSVLCGAVWGMVPAIFKARWNTNETLFTLMMNYVALQLVSYFIIIWEVPKGAGKIGIINSQTMVGWLPSVAGQKYLLNIIVVAVLTIIMHIYLNYTKHGYEITVVGESERTAHYVGIKVSKVIVRTMALSGALCALAGFLRVAGTDHTLTTTITDGYGFTAVMVSWLAQFNPITMVLTSFILTFMDRGASGISTKFQLNESYADILTGIILFFIIGSEFFIRYRITFRKKGKGEK